MELFVRCKRNGEWVYASYKGQSMETVEHMLADLGATDVEFMDEEAWKAAHPQE